MLTSSLVKSLGELCCTHRWKSLLNSLHFCNYTVTTSYCYTPDHIENDYTGLEYGKSVAIRVLTPYLIGLCSCYIISFVQSESTHGHCEVHLILVILSLSKDSGHQAQVAATLAQPGVEVDKENQDKGT